MSEYLILVNHTKKELLCPWCIKDPEGITIKSTIRQWQHSKATMFLLPELLNYYWGGDNIGFISDWHEDEWVRCLSTYTNVSQKVVDDWNRFADDDEKLSFRECHAHKKDMCI